MSNLLEQASLVMIPSGYKEDVVYSEIPLDGSGDLSFTRASNGTRVNFDGLVEVVPWNLLTYSEALTPNWGKSSLTFNSTVTAPNGTTTALNYSTAGAFAYALQTITVASGEYYTSSCYLKYTSGVGSIAIRYTDAASVNFISVTANLINGTIGSVSYGGNGANGTATITSVGDGWYRVTVSGTLIISTAGFIVSNLGLGATTFSIWGAQLNIGSTAKPYFPTTDRLNVPRLTYQNGGGGCPSLLLEKQSTNIVFPSEDFSTTWSAINTTVTTNQATAPDGNTTADRISITSNGGYIRRFNLTTANSSTYTASVYVKNDTISAGNTFNFYFNNNLLPPNSAEGFATININSGTVTSSSGGSGISNVSASIESLINGWYRVNLTFTLGSLAGGNNCEIGFTASTATRTFFAWGAQLEASSYPTSYIPTTSASATRVADACFKTGISSLIGQTSGTIFWDINFVADGTEQTINISDGTNFIYLQKYIDNKIYTGVYNGSFVGSITSSVLTSGRKKIAFGYILNSLILYINGVSIGTDLTSTIPTCDRLSLTVSNTGSIETNNFILFPTKLTNAELASLTTI
jgi:hypothetical protein